MCKRRILYCETDMQFNPWSWEPAYTIVFYTCNFVVYLWVITWYLFQYVYERLQEQGDMYHVSKLAVYYQTTSVLVAVSLSLLSPYVYIVIGLVCGVVFVTVFIHSRVWHYSRKYQYDASLVTEI